MEIAVIGHPCYDIIHKGEREIHSYGGIIYSLIGLILISKPEDKIYPIFQINSEHFAKYFEIIENFPQIDFKFIERNNLPINTVNLFFQGENLQFECYKEKQSKINVQNLMKLSINTNFYVNMISGFELEIDDLKFIKDNFNGKVYFDFHTLTRGINSEGKRFYRPLNDWLQWLDQCDVVQMNDTERKSIPPVDLTEEQFVHEALQTNLKVVNITKGKEGAVTYYKVDTRIEKISMKPEQTLSFKSNVGCGDLFGAIFAYEYFRGAEIKDCLKRSVLISSRRVEIESLQEILTLKKLL